MRVTTRLSVWLRTAVLAMVFLGAAGAASAQNDPNPGALSVTAGLDVPTLYFFRGIRQEVDQKLTLWPFGDLGIVFFSDGGGPVKSAGVNVGVWNSLHTGSSGSDGPADKLHYEQDFYTTLTLGFGSGVGVATTYTAYTSPNNMFTNVKELSFKVTKAHWLAPYGVLAFEFGGDESGQADGGHAFGGDKGTYLELGVGPSWGFGDGLGTLAVPVKLGLSLKDYYERIDETGAVTDEKFGFFDVGALVTFPLTGIPSSFGAWNFHAGADLLVFGETTKAANLGDSSKLVALFGIGLSY